MKKFYCIVVSCGHVGRGKSIEVKRYFEADNLMHAYDSAKHMPRSKKKIDSVKHIEEISYEDYKVGKVSEKENFYLNS